MFSAQPEVKWRLGGYELYVNVMEFTFAKFGLNIYN